VTASQAALLASQPPEIQAQIMKGLTDPELEALERDWRFWGRPEQIAPDGKWGVWLILAGRGFGKTEAGANWIKEREAAGARSIALIAETQKDLEEVMVPRILGLYTDAERPTVRYKPVRILWPSGAQALGYNGTEPKQLRGPEFDTAWVDELAKYQVKPRDLQRETWEMLEFTMRVGTDPRVLVSTTPRPTPLMRELVADKHTVITRGSTFDNAANLAKDYLERVKRRFEGRRLGRQELYAEMLDDLPGALWMLDWIDSARRESAPDMQRIVVAVDPSGSAGEADDGDSQGIVVAGLGVDGRGYVLADYSCKLSPSGWGRRAVDAYEVFRADRIIAERNYGGAMVEHVIRTANPKVPYREVTASRGKVVRAEPVAALYEQGRVSHVGTFPELEDQMCMIGPNGYVGEGSPDRADALVWALSDLMLEPERPAAIFGTYGQ
jgi:phage terminase large subunit-like protein